MGESGDDGDDDAGVVVIAGGGDCDRGFEALTPVGFAATVGDAGAGCGGECFEAVAFAIFAVLLSAEAATLFTGPVAMVGDVLFPRIQKISSSESG